MHSNFCGSVCFFAECQLTPKYKQLTLGVATGRKYQSGINNPVNDF